MKKTFTLLFLFSVLIIAIPQVVHAQYTTGIGVRVGKFASGISVKHFFDTNGNTAMEFFGGYTHEAKGGYLGRVFFLKQKTILNPRVQIPVDFVFGIGAHTGYYIENYYSIKEGNPVYYNNNTIAMGIDAQFGLEYNSRKVPFTVGIDAIPYYSLLHPGPEWLDLGFSMRYKFR